MARTFGSAPGGILSLDVLIEKYPEAIGHDLIRYGLRLRHLGTEKLSWLDLRDVMRYLPPDSALQRELHPEAAQWRTTDLLLADVVDHLRLLVWAKSRDGQQGRNRPERVRRPGLDPATERVGTATGVNEMNQFLGWAG